jgi:hypothetical protein
MHATLRVEFVRHARYLLPAGRALGAKAQCV